MIFLPTEKGEERPLFFSPSVFCRYTSRKDPGVKNERTRDETASSQQYLFSSGTAESK